MITSDSRYAPTNVFTVTEGRDKRTLIDASSRPQTTFTRSTTHRFIQGDSLENIAYRYYGDAMQWWRIADANVLFDPLEISEGTLLDIPDTSTLVTL